MQRLEPEHRTECAARPHESHEHDELTKLCICEVIACAREHHFVDAAVITREVPGKLYGRRRTRIGMRAIGRTPLRLAVLPDEGGSARSLACRFAYGGGRRACRALRA